MNNDIKTFFASCRECFTKLPSQCSNPCVTEPPSTSFGPPFASVGLDLFEHGGNKFLICVDKWSGYPVYKRLQTLTAKAITNYLQIWFNLLGWPSTVRSDGGPQFCVLPTILLMNSHLLIIRRGCGKKHQVPLVQMYFHRARLWPGCLRVAECTQIWWLQSCPITRWTTPIHLSSHCSFSSSFLWRQWGHEGQRWEIFFKCGMSQSAQKFPPSSRSRSRRHRPRSTFQKMGWWGSNYFCQAWRPVIWAFFKRAFSHPFP